MYIWSKIYSENWSAFAPDFRELDQNTEYIEREDELDIVQVNALDSTLLYRLSEGFAAFHGDK